MPTQVPEPFQVPPIIQATRQAMMANPTAAFSELRALLNGWGPTGLPQTHIADLIRGVPDYVYWALIVEAADVRPCSATEVVCAELTNRMGRAPWRTQNDQRAQQMSLYALMSAQEHPHLWPLIIHPSATWPDATPAELVSAWTTVMLQARGDDIQALRPLEQEIIKRNLMDNALRHVNVPTEPGTAFDHVFGLATTTANVPTSVWLSLGRTLVQSPANSPTSTPQFDAWVRALPPGDQEHICLSIIDVLAADRTQLPKDIMPWVELLMHQITDKVWVMEKITAYEQHSVTAELQCDMLRLCANHPEIGPDRTAVSLISKKVVRIAVANTMMGELMPQCGPKAVLQVEKTMWSNANMAPKVSQETTAVQKLFAPVLSAIFVQLPDHLKKKWAKRLSLCSIVPEIQAYVLEQAVGPAPKPSKRRAM